MCVVLDQVHVLCLNDLYFSHELVWEPSELQMISHVMNFQLTKDIYFFICCPHAALCFPLLISSFLLSISPDMINMFRLQYVPSYCSWLFAGRATTPAVAWWVSHAHCASAHPSSLSISSLLLLVTLIVFCFAAFVVIMNTFDWSLFCRNCVVDGVWCYWLCVFVCLVVRWVTRWYTCLMEEVVKKSWQFWIRFIRTMSQSWRWGGRVGSCYSHLTLWLLLNSVL